MTWTTMMMATFEVGGIVHPFESWWHRPPWIFRQNETSTVKEDTDRATVPMVFRYESADLSNVFHRRHNREEHLDRAGQRQDGENFGNVNCSKVHEQGMVAASNRTIMHFTAKSIHSWGPREYGCHGHRHQKTIAAARFRLHATDTVKLPDGYHRLARRIFVFQHPSHSLGFEIIGSLWDLIGM
jgi:hypothetical protein